MNYDHNKIEDYEEIKVVPGMEKWVVIKPTSLDIYLKAAKLSCVDLDSTKLSTGMIQMWCPENQDMEGFINVVDKLRGE